MIDSPQQKLLDAAGEEFADKGFDGATVRDICKRAGMNIAAVNYHFGDKFQLYIEAVKQAHGKCVDLQAFPNDLPAPIRLKLFIRHMMAEMINSDSPAWHTAIIMREMAKPTDACVELVRSFIGPRFALLMSVIEDIVPADMALVDRHLHAFSIVGQCLLYRFHRPVGRLLVGEDEFQTFFDLDKTADHVATFSLRALGIDPTTVPALESVVPATALSTVPALDTVASAATPTSAPSVPVSS